MTKSLGELIKELTIESEYENLKKELLYYQRENQRLRHENMELYYKLKEQEKEIQKLKKYQYKYVALLEKIKTK
jgi:regulator of replication initiation timing